MLRYATRDTESVVRERLKIYWRDTRPMIEYYGSRPTFRSIDGAQRPEQVRQALVAAIAELAAAAGVSARPARSGVSAGKGVGA